MWQALTPFDAGAVQDGARSDPMTTVASKRVYLETLGCSKNRVDSEVMLAHLTQAGYELVESEQNAEVIIVNTCGFLTAASEESVNRILELSDQKSSGSCEKLVATGCLTQRYREELSEEIPELDGLLGSHGFEHIPELLSIRSIRRFSSRKNPTTRITSSRSVSKALPGILPM